MWNKCLCKLTFHTCVSWHLNKWPYWFACLQYLPILCTPFFQRNATHIIYSNVIRYGYTTIEGNITRENSYRVEVSCDFPRDLYASQGMIPQTESVTQRAPGSYNIRMDFFRNNSFIYPAVNYPLVLILGEWLYVALTLEEADSNIKLVVPDCIATPTTQANHPTSYPLYVDKSV